MTMQKFTAWGKTDSDRRPSHHLIHHCMDVAAVFEQLLLHPVIAARLEKVSGRQLDGGEREWLAAWAFLHDLGKLSPRFQAKAWPEGIWQHFRGHLQEGWQWVQWVGQSSDELSTGVAKLFSSLSAENEEHAYSWISALFAHHGTPTRRGNDAVWPVLEPYDWRIEQVRMGDALAIWFPNAIWREPSPILKPRFVHLCAGLLALADWIGSDTAVFPHELALDIPAYADRARSRAQHAVRRVGLADPAWPSSEPSFFDLTGFETVRGVQATIAKVPLDSSLVIIEAETGSGKTEAALMHFARLRSAGRVDGLYFAVPTRAAAWQLFERVRAAMLRIGGPEAILAVPGQLRAGDATGVRLPGYEVRWDDGSQHWAAEHATRFLAAPVAVGTVDQLLMAGLQVKHSPLRAAAMSRSLLVVDEVHASDAYMNRIARSIVEDHRLLGGPVLLMSATLGAAARSEWFDQPLPALSAAIKTAYPAIWHEESAEPLIVEQQIENEKRVQPRLVDTMAPETAAGIAIDAARAGARVLIIRNTVDRAVATWQAILDTDDTHCLRVAGVPALHHSRFAAEDRRALDVAVEKAFGKNTAGGAVIAVGTQTLEQSLDIDADILITDLCPMDVLLQRIGRLHRHSRSRPASFEAPQVHILCPDHGLDVLAKEKRFENGLGAWEARGVLNGIYIDLRAVEATRRLASERKVWKIPADNRDLVESATHPEVLEAIDHEMGWQDYTRSVVAKALAEEQAAGLYLLDRKQHFPDKFAGSDEIIHTRLGSAGPLWQLPDDTLGPFGLPITSIAPPAQWCRGMSGEETIEVTPHADRLTIVVGDREFGYTAAGLCLETKSR